MVLLNEVNYEEKSVHLFSVHVSAGKWERGVEAVVSGTRTVTTKEVEGPLLTTELNENKRNRTIVATYLTSHSPLGPRTLLELEIFEPWYVPLECPPIPPL